ncbi:hypothetical protein D9753_36105 [Streptomyces dangxiongensis]|uniref:Uncharacterized protein n=1 Tax=Streptomyces dangxiongensis TaxID=1442032 RepID=A0A3G2J8C8_9ACTN|nr:hypothetical protein D9753_00280 [Streptomyces dangxiongensis]AYN43371.1 hypothetical protein D9753_36105 [Streptomyces dangxiongensis]
MAHQSFLLNSARHLRSLVAEDEEAVRAAAKRVQEAQESLEDAQLRAEASREVLQSVESRLSKVVGSPLASQDVLFPSTTADANASTPPMPVVDLIREFLRPRGEATTGEIIEHVRQSRPSTNSSNVSPELSRLVKMGDVVRPRQGVYSLSPTAKSHEGSA